MSALDPFLSEVPAKPTIQSMLVPLAPRVVKNFAFTDVADHFQITHTDYLGTNAKRAMIGFHATEACYILFGVDGVTVTSTTGMPLAKDEKFYCALETGYEYVAVIRATTTSGALRMWLASP